MFRTVSVALFLACSIAAVSAQTTTFTYQGQLSLSGSNATGPFDFRFRLFSALTGGSNLGSELSRDDVTVEGGNFAVTLDFGDQFNTTGTRWLEIDVRSGTSTGAFTTLSPRQQITASPFAIQTIRATFADTAANAQAVGGIPAANIVNTADPRLTDARPPTPNSGNYVQNTSTTQANSNFNISGNGRANSFDSGTQYNIRGIRVLSMDGTGNVIVGENAGNNNNAPFNSFFGNWAGWVNSSGNSNAFFGNTAGLMNSTGSGNSFYGALSGRNNTTGGSLSYFGTFAGYENTTGNFNSFFGSSVGRNNTTGSDNAFFGISAGKTNSTGSRNSAIGSYADVGSANLSNATAIGGFSMVTQSNSLVLGSINGVNSATADTNVGIGTTAPSARLSVFGGGFGSNILVSDTNTTATTFDLANTSTNGKTWRFQSLGSGDAGRVGNLELWNVGGPNILGIRPNGNVGIGTVTPESRLHVAGGLTVTGPLNYFDTAGNANFFMKGAGAANGINFGVAANAGSNSTLYISQYDGTSYQDRIVIKPDGMVEVPGNIKTQQVQALFGTFPLVIKGRDGRCFGLYVPESAILTMVQVLC